VHGHLTSKDRKCATLLLGLGCRNPSEKLWGITLSGGATREAPVRTEPHPTQSFALRRDSLLDRYTVPHRFRCEGEA
jgi:hypothetical protein